MSLEKLKATANQLLARLPTVRGRGEEATKQALVLPMIDALGYDIWNPAEVCPEFEADFAIKKAGQKEKVDIAISIGGVPRIYFEVKPVDSALEGHEGQLARYFNATTDVSLAIITNGIEYRFFTDTGDPNVMDSKPFHVAKLDAVDPGLEVLARFSKAVFSPEAIRDFATELNFTAKMVGVLRNELDIRDREPSERMVRWILSEESMYPGRVTAAVVERFSPIVRNALQIVLRDIVRRSVAAMDKEVAAPSPAPPEAPATAEVAAPKPAPPSPGAEVDKEEERSRIVTTERELECFGIVKALFDTSIFAKETMWDSSVRKEVPVTLAYKDTTGYFAIYLNKPAFWAIRLAVDGKNPWIGFAVNPEKATALIPAGFTRLDSHPFADFRIQVSGPQDLNALNRLVFESFRSVLDERRAPKPGAPPQKATEGGS